MTPESVQMLFALALGFAVAGLCSSGYQLATSRLLSFNQLSTGPGPGTIAAIPLLVLSAPFLIMRNTVLGRRQEGRRFEFVFLATLIAGFWSLMSGTGSGDDTAGLRHPARLRRFPRNLCSGKFARRARSGDCNADL